jgi:hypothetical protein
MCKFHRQLALGNSSTWQQYGQSCKFVILKHGTVTAVQVKRGGKSTMDRSNVETLR